MAPGGLCLAGQIYRPRADQVTAAHIGRSFSRDGLGVNAPSNLPATRFAGRSPWAAPASLGSDLSHQIAVCTVKPQARDTDVSQFTRFLRGAAWLTGGPWSDGRAHPSPLGWIGRGTRKTRTRSGNPTEPSVPDGPSGAS